MGGVPLAESIWTRLLDDLCGCLNSLVRLTRWSGLATILSSWWDYDVASLP